MEEKKEGLSWEKDGVPDIKTKKAGVPPITKIVSWLIILTSGWLIAFLLEPLSHDNCGDLPCTLGLPLIVVPLLLLIPAIFVLKRRKWAWDILMNILYLLSAFFILIMFGDLGLMALTPIIIVFFLFVDRKNYWKIAS